MQRLLGMATREVYRRELLPSRVRWWLAAEGMCDWYRVLSRELRPHVGDGSRALLSKLSVRMFERRYEVLRTQFAHLPDDREAMALVMSALYRVQAGSKRAWIFDAIGGVPRGVGARIRAERLLLPMRSSARWEEVTTHLGELLIVLTEDLPEHLPHARKVLSDICFTAGARFASHAKKAFGMPDDPDDAPALAIEVLRMSEYVFRVNPKHWAESDAASNTGYLEGTACPWYMRPGWNGAHCGIFGQFQSGISSAFGLRYQLSTTIPKNGGLTCRIDLKPIPLRKKPIAEV